MENILNNISASVPTSEDEYIGEDGLLHCSKCHKPVQLKIQILGKERIVRCICDCRKAELDAEKEASRKEELARERQKCFPEANMWQWDFEHDDKQNEKLTNAMKRYVSNFTEFKKQGKGLLLYGPVGTGKTYFAACVANALIDKDYSVLMTNFARLTNQLQGMFEGKQEYIDSLNKYSLLIIDDLGTERKSEFMQEQVFNIIDSRYRSGLPFIITTNLTPDEIKKPQDVGYSRIYDRVLERCFPIEVAGKSRRRQKVRETFTDVKDILGL